MLCIWNVNMISKELDLYTFFFFSSRRRHTRYWRDWSSDVCSSDLAAVRNLGAPKYAFFSMLAGALCNVFFDWIFIFPMQLGIQGAAIATSMGQIVSFFLLFFFFRNKRIFIPLLPRKISWSLLQRLFSIGFSSFIMEFSAAIVLVLRSEEHTSELQSRQYLVCRLLLEKKKRSAHLRITITTRTC